MVKKSKVILISMFAIILAACASQIGPGGGEIDKIPPKILESYPVDGTINYKENYFEVTFSEYVEHRSVQDAIFISPALEKGFEYDWTGKTLTVEFKDTLQSNTTYTIAIGTDAADINNGNKMEEAFTFAFSTGNKIDKGKISGKVYDEKPEGVMIYAYQKDGEVDPSQTKPNYISQVGKLGNYSMVGLRDGNYKVLAVRDKMKDMLYQKNDDEFGVQTSSIELHDSLNTFIENNFFLTVEDTIPPKLSSAFMKDRNHVVVEFSEPVDSTKLSVLNFSLIDTLKNKRIQADYFFKSELKPNQFCIAFKDTTSFNEFILSAENFEDKFGNVSHKDHIQFIYKSEKDTFTTKLVKAFGDMPNEKVDYENPSIKILFNDGIKIEELNSRLSVEDSKKNKLYYAVNKLDDALFLLKMDSKLKPGMEYSVLFDAKNLQDFSGKSIDTVYESKFSTCNELDFSGVSGNVVLNDSSDVFMVIEKTDSPKHVYQQKTDAKKKFDFKRVVPGKYVVWSYKDKNKNNKYDTGTINPFKYSEEFKFYPDTLNLRARWPVGDVNINFEKK